MLACVKLLCIYSGEPLVTARSEKNTVFLFYVIGLENWVYLAGGFVGLF